MREKYRNERKYFQYFGNNIQQKSTSTYNARFHFCNVQYQKSTVYGIRSQKVRDAVAKRSYQGNSRDDVKVFVILVRILLTSTC